MSKLTARTLSTDSPLAGPIPLQDQELAELQQFLRERSIASVVGLLAAVVSIPEALPATTWMAELMKGIDLDHHQYDASSLQRFANLIMRLKDHVAAAFVEQDAQRICPNDEAADPDFCHGYLSIVDAAGIDPTSNWALELLGRIARDEKERDDHYDFDAIVALLYNDWHPQEPQLPMPRPLATPPSPPKVGRNEPCHCGSGQKFKKCHGAPPSQTKTT